MNMSTASPNQIKEGDSASEKRQVTNQSYNMSFQETESPEKLD